MNHASFARLPRRNRLLPVTEGTSCTSRRARGEGQEKGPAGGAGGAKSREETPKRAGGKGLTAITDRSMTLAP
jgi:hypothetical protein